MRDFLLVASIVLISFLVLVININKPFVGIHDFNGAQVGNAARNYMRYGVWDIKFGQVITQYNGDPKELKTFYTSYLPMLPLLVALSFILFGVSETSARLVPVIFSMIGVVSFYLIVRHVWSEKTALYSVVFYIGTPMFIYFGKMPVFDIPILSMSLLSIYLYMKWTERFSKKTLFCLCLTLFFGGLNGWIIVYLAPLFILHGLFSKKINWQYTYPILTLFSVLILQLLHNYVLVGSLFAGPMFDSLRNRLMENNLSFGGVDFGLGSYIKHEVAILSSFFTKTLIAISLYVIISTFFNLLKNKSLNLKDSMLIFLLIFGILHPLLFSKVVFIHEYENIYMLPFLALCGGIFMSGLANKLNGYKLDKKIISSLIGLIFVLFLVEKVEFTKTLIESDMNLPGYQMAQLINSLQTKGGEVTIISPRFGSFHGIFANFYSEYYFGIGSWQDLEEGDILERYKYVIIPKEDVASPHFYDKLISEYRNIQTNDHTLIYVNERRED